MGEFVQLKPLNTTLHYSIYGLLDFTQRVPFLKMEMEYTSGWLRKQLSGVILFRMPV